MNENLTQILSPIIKKAGDIMLTAHGATAKAVKAGDVNFVTVYDEMVQAFLIEEIKKVLPNAKFIAEEKENDFALLSSELCFIIDPIDGTTNFMRDYKSSAISVGAFSRGVGVFGGVFNPYLNELFTAELNKGAYLNGEKISVSTNPIERAVYAFGSSPYYKSELAESTFSIAKAMFFKAMDIRRTGSAALDFCNIACGRTDVFFECRLSPWDFAAGAVIVKEAGGVITNLVGNELDFSKPQSILCSNTTAYSSALQVVKSVYKPING